MLIPVFEGLSRMYRGMHHPLDVAGGVVIGIASAVRPRACAAVQRAQPPPVWPGIVREGRRHRACRGSRSDGGLPGAAPGSRAGGIADPFGTRSEEPQGAQGDAPLLDAETELVFVWGGDGMLQRCIDVAGRLRRRPRDPSGRNGESARHEPRRARRHRAGGRDRPRRRPPPPRRWPLQRRALRGHGRQRHRRDDDPRCRRRPQGSVAAPPTCGRGEPARRTFGAEIEVDGAAGSAARRRCVLVGNVGELIGRVEVFETRGPTTARSRSASSPPRGPQWMRTLARTVVGRRGVAVRAGGEARRSK